MAVEFDLSGYEQTCGNTFMPMLQPDAQAAPCVTHDGCCELGQNVPCVSLAAWNPPELSSSAPVRGSAQLTFRTDDAKLIVFGNCWLGFHSVANTLVNLMCSTPEA